MQETLRLSAAASSTNAAAAPLPSSASIFRPKHLHFPSPPPNNEIPLTISPPPSAPNPTKFSQLQEKLLYLDSLGIDSFYCLHVNPSLYSTPLSQVKSTCGIPLLPGSDHTGSSPHFPHVPGNFNLSLCPLP
ncbi:Uncharacterized protein Adt_07882 [Abeliophyllum distichum]|uniref:Uncharacterized protein n=1 Tax=Abeliophyllum distichum TaxID=126358 RepID=A0ABD1VBE3_9LAMI